MVTLQLVTELQKQKHTAEQELSTLKEVLKDVEQMLVQHQKNISETDNNI
jgi:molybdopterin converting factor small subunit